MDLLRARESLSAQESKRHPSTAQKLVKIFLLFFLQKIAKIPPSNTASTHRPPCAVRKSAHRQQRSRRSAHPPRSPSTTSREHPYSWISIPQKTGTASGTGSRRARLITPIPTETT